MTGGILLSNLFYDQFFNLQYVNSDYYHRNQEQIAQYNREQSEEVQNVVKSVRDLCKAVKILDSQHQQQAFGLALAEMARELGWNNV